MYPQFGHRGVWEPMRLSFGRAKWKKPAYILELQDSIVKIFPPARYALETKTNYDPAL
jgi:hypothetical protein